MATLFGLLAALAGGVCNPGFAQVTAHFGGVQSTVGTGLSECFGVAVDGNGNVYIADTYNNRVLKETPSGGSYTQTIVASGFNIPYGVAVDSTGNVYVADTYNNRIVKETWSSGSYTPTVVASVQNPWNIAVDGSGNVYVAGGNSGTSNTPFVYKETPSGQGYTQSLIANASNGLMIPWEVAVDGAGNVFVSDTRNNAVYKESLSGSTYTQSTVATGLDFPSGVAVDKTGNVYISNAYTNQVLIETPASGSTYTQSILPTGTLSFPYEIAVDGNGNVYIANAQAFDVLKQPPASRNFGAGNIGSTGSTLSLAFTFDTAGSIGAPSVVTQGIANLDFTDAGTGTCTTNGTSYAYNLGDTCTVDVIFTPKAPGIRSGAAVLKDTSGTVIATGYVQGTGVGPQVSFPPGVQSQLSFPDVASPYAIATDAAGNLYIANAIVAYDPANSVVKETWNGSAYTQSTVATGFGFPTGIAMDGAGNIYVADQDGFTVFKETPAANGSYIQSVVDSTLGTVGGIAVDGVGNVYVGRGGIGVEKETLSGGSYIRSQIFYTFYAESIAVDASGNLYFASANNTAIVKETPSGSGYVQSTFGSIDPLRVAVDELGNVYAMTGFNMGSIWKEEPSGSSYVETELASGLNGLVGLALDGAGNVYFSGANPADVGEISSSYPPALQFAATAVGQTSADSPQTVTLENAGNASLSFPVPSTGNNPSIATSFTLNSSGASACPLVEAGAEAAGTLAAGASCQLSISFAPAGVGAVSGSLILTDDNLNATAPGYATQSVSLSGTATQGTPAITWATPAAIIYGTALSATQLNASTIVTGSFTYSPAAGTVLGAGPHTLTASFTPTDTTDYTTATATVTLTVSQATPTITWAPPAAVVYGTALSATQLNASSTTAGTFVYSPAVGKVLGAGPHTLTATFTPTDSVDYTTATANVTLTVNAAAPTITWATPLPITYGAALSTTQLNASSTVAGTFSYSPAAGTVLTAGSQTLTVTFTPSDTTDYTTATANVTLTVNNATPTITWATPAAISYGTALSATQLNASSTVAGAFVYSPAAGTVLSVGPQTLAATFTPTDTTDYTTATATVMLAVNKATAAIAVVSSANPAFVSSPVTLTATVSSSAGTPTGTVSFYDGTTLLGPDTLSAGTATYTTSRLASGSHSITAVYSGDGNFTTVTSAVLAQTIETITLGPSTGSGSATASPGGQATYTLAVNPPSGTTLAGPITFSVSGLPAGATAVFSPTTVPAGAGATNVTLTVTLPSQSAVRPTENPFGKAALPVALGLIVLPFAGRLRRASRSVKGTVLLMVLGLTSAAMLAGLTGCGGGGGGSKTSTPQNYTLTITATSGSFSQATTVSLTVE